MMVAIAHEVVLSWGWRRRAYAFLSGAVGALAMAPINFFPAMFVPMVVSVWLIDGCVGRTPKMRKSASWSKPLLEAGEAGWWLGFGYFVAGLWWLGAAFLVEADQFAWALPLGILGLPAVLAIFSGVGFFLARMIWSAGSARILALAAGLGCAEWFRGHLFTGFPWNAFGMSLAGNIVTSQFASIAGLYGLTVLSIAIFAAPATLIDETGRAGQGNDASRFNWRPISMAGLVLLGLGVFGLIRLSGPLPEMVSGVRLRIMQPNLQQDEKFRAENKNKILQQYLALSDRATSPTTSGLADVTHLFWPESAFPFVLSRDPEAIRQISTRLSGGSILITGAARLETSGQNNRGARYFNSIQILTKDGVADAYYDKNHLVPFGEYLPLDWLLETFRLRQFVHIPGGFTAGTGSRLLSVPGLPVAEPLICYEAIFPDGPISGSSQAKYLLNVTNDGWFGMTAGPYQHFAQARLRTIEQGLPMVRAANTGISAIIDPYGRIIASLSLGTEGVLDGQLPLPIEATFFARSPHTAVFVIWLFSALWAMWGWLRNRRPVA